MKTITTLLVFIVLLISTPIQACGEESNQKLLTDTVASYVSNKEGLLSTLVQVNIPGQKPMKTAIGFLDISKTTPVKPEHKFLIGSITKVFTATMVHQLMEQQKAELENPLTTYLSKEWSEALKKIKHGEEITVGLALSHRSGLFDVTMDRDFFGQIFADISKKRTALEIIGLIPSMGEPEFEPGKGYSYSNCNYLLLGAMIENLTQKTYSEVLKETILSKIRLKNTFMSEGLFGSDKEGICHGYMKIGEDLYDGQDFDSGFAWTAGAIVSSAGDLNLFFAALAEGKLFKDKDTFRLMRKTRRNGVYGFGVEVHRDSELGVSYGHRGNFGNTSCISSYFPELKTAITVCHNYDGSARRLDTKVLSDLVIKKLKSQ